MEALVENNLKEEASRLELVTKKLNTLNVIQVTPVSFVLYSVLQNWEFVIKIKLHIYF